MLVISAVLRNSRKRIALASQGRGGFIRVVVGIALLLLLCDEVFFRMMEDTPIVSSGDRLRPHSMWTV